MENNITWLMIDEPYEENGQLYVKCEPFIIVKAKYYSLNTTVTLDAPINYDDPTGLDITNVIEETISSQELSSIKEALEAKIDA